MPSVGDLLGGVLGWVGDTAGGAVAEVLDPVMKFIWGLGLGFLFVIFDTADDLSVFTVDVRTGPVAAVWPTMLWLSGLVALGLFFVQLSSATLRGGYGFLRVITGPIQYGLALTITVAAVAGLLAATDGLTKGILNYGTDTDTFREALHVVGITDAIGDAVSGVLLGVIAIISVFPAAFGFLLEMIFRQAAILLLVATVPITAAGLVAQVTAPMFWRAIRWCLAAIFFKPVLALTFVIGAGIFAGRDTVKDFLVGIGILWIALFIPFVLFRLFAFVDPNTDAGRGFRDWARGSRGMDSFGADNPVREAEVAAAQAGINRAFGLSGDNPADGSGSSGNTERGAGQGGDDNDVEAAHNDRFARAEAEHSPSSESQSQQGRRSTGESAGGDVDADQADQMAQDTAAGAATGGTAGAAAAAASSTAQSQQGDDEGRPDSRPTAGPESPTPTAAEEGAEPAAPAATGWATTPGEGQPSSPEPGASETASRPHTSPAPTPAEHDPGPPDPGPPPDSGPPSESFPAANGGSPGGGSERGDAAGQHRGGGEAPDSGQPTDDDREVPE